MFHFQMDEFVEFDRVFHGKFFGEFGHESENNHAHGIGFGDTAGHEIKEMFVADFSDGCFVREDGVFLFDLHRGIGIGS